MISVPNSLSRCTVSVLLAIVVPAAHAASRDPVYAEHGMVVSASSHASEAGVRILQAGGNAVDAAAATAFSLAVTLPWAGNIGGGGFMVVRKADGEVFTLDFREKAPGAAHRDMFLDKNGDVIKGLSLVSALASGVPGSVDGLLRAWRDHGSGEISRRELMESAIRLASDGFALDRQLAKSLNGKRNLFLRDPGAAAIFVREDGRPWRPGDVFKQPDLARTLRRIAREGPAGFYEGEVAELIAMQQQATGGLITRDDLKSYESVYRPAVTGSFHEYEIISMGPPSSGGVILIEMLHMLELYPLADLGWNSSQYIHVLTEVERRAYADRAKHLGDPDFWDVPIEALLSKSYARDRAADIDMQRATPSADIEPGDATQYESPETTHLSVVDPAGNAVALTTTLNRSFGSGLVVDGAGFLLNNEMDDFSAKPGVPNVYGLVGGEANAIEPGKRMLSSMTPTLIVKDGRTVMVLGTPGGATIITTVLQNFLNVAIHKMDIQEAIAAPRHHHQWVPDRIYHEERAFPDDVRENLIAMGHTLYQRTDMGHANAIFIGVDGLYGAPDPRGENAAAGF